MSHQHHHLTAARDRSAVRRGLAAVVLAAACVVATSATASAAPSRGGCPNAWHWNATDLTTWTKMSEAGIIAEFESMEAGAKKLGFPSVDALRNEFVKSFKYVDSIAPGPRDGTICVSSVHAPGQPAFMFSVHNNKFRP